jgi:hypothetical protein
LISCVDCYDILQYEDEIRQDAARKSVPVEELEEKALVSLAKVRACKFIFQEKILTPCDQLCIEDIYVHIILGLAFELEMLLFSATIVYYSAKIVL